MTHETPKSTQDARLLDSRDTSNIEFAVEQAAITIEDDVSTTGEITTDGVSGSVFITDGPSTAIVMPDELADELPDGIGVNRLIVSSQADGVQVEVELSIDSSIVALERARRRVHYELGADNVTTLVQDRWIRLKVDHSVDQSDLATCLADVSDEYSAWISRTVGWDDGEHYTVELKPDS